MSDQKPIEVFIPIYKFKVGFLWIPFKPPAQSLSDLIIDVNKDWKGYVIKNLGAPVDPNDSLRLIDLINHRTSTPIDHPDGSVTAEKIAAGSITTEKIADGSVTRAKLSGVFPITTSDIADGSITTSKIADGSVTRAKIESPLTLSNVILEVLTSDPPLAVGRIWYRSDLDRISYSPDGVNIRRIPPSPIGSSDIADGSITTAKISDGAVTTSKLADGSITTSKIADASITPPKINSVTAPSNGYVLSYDGSSGLFKWISPPSGVTALSQLTIDVDKDWGGHVIKNLGAPVDPGDSLRLQDLTSHRTASPIDHPDGSITTAKIADGSITRAKLVNPDTYFVTGYTASDSTAPAERFPRSATDLWIVQGSRLKYATSCSVIFNVANMPTISDGFSMSFGYLNSKFATAFRITDYKNMYVADFDTPATTADWKIQKVVAGTWTTLATEAVDISAGAWFSAILEVVGTSLKAERIPGFTVLTATDSSLTSGKGGYGRHDINDFILFLLVGRYSSPPSVVELPKPVAYFEVPVTGDGTPLNPFRPQMPEEIAMDPVFGRVNRLSLTHSSLIKTDKAGKPIDYVAIVRIFDQPNRQAHLHPIPKALDTLRSMKGVRRLSREEAIRRAKQLDPDLTDVDLIPIPSTHPNFRQILKDYIEHRKGLGVREDLIDEKLMEQYLQEDKGW